MCGHDENGDFSTTVEMTSREVAK